MRMTIICTHTRIQVECVVLCAVLRPKSYVKALSPNDITNPQKRSERYVDSLFSTRAKEGVGRRISKPSRSSTLQDCRSQMAGLRPAVGLT